MLKQRPANWAECVARSRIEFEKYYNHKASVFNNLIMAQLLPSGGKPTTAVAIGQEKGGNN